MLHLLVVPESDTVSHAQERSVEVPRGVVMAACIFQSKKYLSQSHPKLRRVGCPNRYRHYQNNRLTCCSDYFYRVILHTWVWQCERQLPNFSSCTHSQEIQGQHCPKIHIPSESVWLTWKVF